MNADRCSLFLVDSKTNELYANLFDEGEDENREYRFRNGKEIRYAASGQSTKRKVVLQIVIFVYRL